MPAYTNKIPKQGEIWDLNNELLQLNQTQSDAIAGPFTSSHGPLEYLGWLRARITSDLLLLTKLNN